MKTLIQEHREEQYEAWVERTLNMHFLEGVNNRVRATEEHFRLLREKDEAWFAYSAARENERRQRCFGIVALMMLVIVVIGILVVINANK